MKTEPDPTWKRLCAESSVIQIEGMMREGEGVIAQDGVENVHRMRVASRRARAVLDTFEECLPPEKAGPLRKEIRRITRALGAARDADVQIGLLAEMLPNMGPREAPGIKLVLRWKTQERAKLQAPLVRALRGLEERGLLFQMLDHFRAERDSLRKQGVPERSPAAYENAWRRVRGMVDELLEHEGYVHQEAAIEEHHAMRISSKRLRYALEMIEPLFDDRLEVEISRIKKLQELLGDMHDCDVWTQEMDRLIADLRQGKLELPQGMSAERMRPGLTFLRDDRSKRRREIYREFTELWDSMTAEGFLDSLLRRLETASEQTEDLSSRAIEALTADPGIKIAVIGDVHGNLQALEAVLKDAERRGCKVLLNTGDVLGYGADPEKVAKLLRSKPCISIIGNYDLKAFRIHEHKDLWPGDKPKDKLLAFEWAYEHISPATRAWLKSLPQELRMDLGGQNLLMVHGSPDSMDEHLGPETPERRLEEIAEAAGADLIIVGHSHLPMSRTVKGVRFLNPGSVGRPDDGDPRASYALLQLSPFRASLHRVRYDVRAAARAIKDAGLPKRFARMIIEGRAYDRVAEKEGKKVSQDSALRKTWKVARSYLGKDPHTDQVTSFSMKLFDCLAERLDLSGRDRFWLECAAVLHDIGWSEGRRGHHKASLRLILEEDALPFDREERRTIGCIARYHRKAPPDPSHAHYSNLGRKERRKVASLAAILRVADALDCSHDVKVRSLRCRLTSDKLVLLCTATSSLEMEEKEVLKKGDLLREVADLEIEVRREARR
jgi:putative phosphoesterase